MLDIVRKCPILNNSHPIDRNCSAVVLTPGVTWLRAEPEAPQWPYIPKTKSGAILQNR
jgi:hypothetical protein